MWEAHKCFNPWIESNPAATITTTNPCLRTLQGFFCLKTQNQAIHFFCCKSFHGPNFITAKAVVGLVPPLSAPLSGLPWYHHQLRPGGNKIRHKCYATINNNLNWLMQSLKILLTRKGVRKDIEVRSPEGEIVTEKLHDQCTVLVWFLSQCV